MTVRDRIKRFERVKASDLLANPNNWREHPEAQANALAAILEDVGIAGALIARETPEGLELIDGHLRADSSPEVEWPVLVLDVDQAEADLLLASYDPLAEMAGTNEQMLTELLNSVKIRNEHLAGLLEAKSDSFDIDETELPSLREGGDRNLTTTTFTLTVDQRERLNAAIKHAKSQGVEPDEENPNSNGNALSFIAESYLAS
tara:strand:+ start:291 stop:899 length:609 start_codon:yes stop_codon:yes gene_type:complete